MKTLDQLLQHLARADVTEVALASGRLPCARLGTALEPIDDVAPSADQILSMLMAVGGSRYLEDLGAAPKQWSARVGGGVGMVSVTAAVPREGEIQARFSLVQKAGAAKKAEARPEPSPPESTERRAPRAIEAVARPVEASPVPDAPRPVEKVPADSKAEAAPILLERVPASNVRPAPTGDSTPTLESSSPATLPNGPFTAVPVTLEAASSRSGAAPVAPEEREGGLRELEPLLNTARSLGATDVHIVAGRPLLLRIGGDLVPKSEPLEARRVDRMLLACVPARVVGSLHELGSCDFALEHPRLGRFRINVVRQQTGLKATIRLIRGDIPTLEMLGLPPVIAAATKHHQGLIVVTGPTGHGKTSTLAAIVDILNRDTTHHIITVEDPIEYVHPKKRAVISQREVGTHTRSFGAALKASLREDPDVIVVGELRDTETVRMAVAASETGHLVLGTMNTPSAAKTIDRLIDLFPPADQPQVRTTLASGLRLIVSQRLVPSVDRSRMFAAVELLPGSIPLSALIRENKTFQIPSLQQRSKALGIIRIDDSLAELVQGLHISLESAKGYAEAPNELEALIGLRRNPTRAADDSLRGAFAKKGA